MEEGIVPGGGMALYNIRNAKITGNNDHDKDVIEAVETILRRAMEAPVSAIIENSGQDKEAILKQLDDKKDAWMGFNALKNEVSNLKNDGVIDPLKVTKTAFINAISVASNYLTMGAAVTDIPEEHDHNAPAPGGMGGMM